MSSSTRLFLLGLGSGRCGTLSLARLLNQQPNAHVTHEARPLLPWNAKNRDTLVAERIARFNTAQARLVGDVASFYLPYVERFISLVPDLRVVCLWRDREEVVESFARWSDQAHSAPADHWSVRPQPGLFHDPVWSTIFPKYDVASREEGIRRYWDEYYENAEELVRKFPGNVRIFDMEASLNTEPGQREVLRFVGLRNEEHVLQVGLRTHRGKREETKDPSPQPSPLEEASGQGKGTQSSSVEREQTEQEEASNSPSLTERVVGTPQSLPEPQPGSVCHTTAKPNQCVILVPHGGQIVSGCEDSLRVLERRGYTVRRVRGYSQIDVARNEIASKAMLDGFLETIWIDSDIGFHPDAVEKLRAHDLPIVCGVYPKKGKREFAISALPGTERLVFGERGGLYEIQYAATGFLLVRRQVYLDIQFKLGLPLCNEQFGANIVPYFMPMTRRLREGHWYLGEDYAFCERARQAGYRIMADTTIRLWHVGSYQYGWEDAGREVQRFSDYTYHIHD